MREAVYGIASGPGPIHVLAGELALCGVKRAEVYPGAGRLLAEQPERLCPRCAAKQGQKPQARDVMPADAADARVAELMNAAKVLTEARERLDEILRGLWSLPNERRNECLRAAFQSGSYTLTSLGNLVGITCERVRQRLAADKGVHQDEPL